MARFQPKPKKPLVSSVSAQLKKTVATSDTQVVTSEEVKETKKKLLGILENATEQFIDNLNNHKVELNTSLDLERLVKLTLILSGEADTITGNPVGQGELETIVGNPAEISMSKVEEILQLDDPQVKAMFEKLYTGYNELNGEED